MWHDQRWLSSSAAATESAVAVYAAIKASPERVRIAESAGIQVPRRVEQPIAWVEARRTRVLLGQGQIRLAQIIRAQLAPGIERVLVCGLLAVEVRCLR